LKLVTTVDDEDPEVVGVMTRYYLEGLAGINGWLMRKKSHKIPPLYESGIRFRLEPWAEQVQFYANALEVLEQGFGDCKMLSAWRVAELRLRHPDLQFGFHLYSRKHDRDPLHGSLGSARVTWVVYHVEVETPWTPPLEDVSRFLHQ
jgi:hypothetical protein